MRVLTESGSVYEIDEGHRMVIRYNDEFGLRGDSQACDLHQFSYPKVGKPMMLWITIPGKDFITHRTTTPVKEVIL